MEKRLPDDDKDAYKVLAMLPEPIVSESFGKFRKEQEKQVVDGQPIMPIDGLKIARMAFPAKQFKGSGALCIIPPSDKVNS